MTCYVDDMNTPFGRMVMCHLIADSTDELLRMVRLIGVNPKWIQHVGTYKEHFDISLGKKKLAIEHGAQEISFTKLGRMVVARKGSPLAKESTS